MMTSSSYPANAEDWRGRFIANLAAGLARQQNITLRIWAPPGELPPKVVSAATPAEEIWLQNLSQRGGIAHLLRGDKLQALSMAAGLLFRLRQAYRRNRVEIMHVNWLQNALALWGTNTPAVISVLGTDFGLLRLPGMARLLRAVFRQRRTILAPNAEWMVPELERTFGDVAEIHPVPFGIDDTWFALQRTRPEDDKHHWLAITRLTKNKIGDLFDWGEGQFGQNRLLHLFGPMQEKVTLPDWAIYHGPTHPAELLASWFPQASGLITLSRHDEGRPQVMLEAMAAGLPIIASDLAAHRDIVRHRETGWLATDRQDFASALNHLEHPKHNRLAGEAARIFVKQGIGTWDDCAARYGMLYQKLLGSPQ